MLLSYLELVELMNRGVMTNVERDMINAASIDVTLGDSVLIEDTSVLRPVELSKRESLAFTKHSLSKDGRIMLPPGAFILAETAQTFDIPLDISAEFRLKSSVARSGLTHALAVWADPGWHGSSLTLELHNITASHMIILRSGDRIGQMIFHRHKPVPYQFSYAARGSYNGDKQATAAKPVKEQP